MYLKSQLCKQKECWRRRLKNPTTVEELINILSQRQNSAYEPAMQNPSPNKIVHTVFIKIKYLNTL